VALSAFATERRAAAPLLLSAGQQSIDISCPSGAQQQTRSSGVRRTKGGTDRQTDGSRYSKMHPQCGGHKSETYRRRSGRRQWLREFAGCTCTCRGCILHRATSRPRPTCRLDHSRGPTNSRPGPATHGSPSGRTRTSQLHTDRQQSDSSVADDTVQNNNNNNNHDNVHGALIMTKVIARVYPVHLMNVD